MSVNHFQKYEWMLRIPICNLQTGMDLIQRLPGGVKSPELLDALEAMDHAIYNLKRWAEVNGVVLRDSMHT